MTQFTITQQHIDLLRHASVRWNDMEFGAPGIDPKMPYGTSMPYYDIADILHIKETSEEDGFDDEQVDLMNKLHRETLTVLQITLDTGEMKPGTYKRDSYGRWQQTNQ